jgi:hypothetical protein
MSDPRIAADFSYGGSLHCETMKNMAPAPNLIMQCNSHDLGVMNPEGKIRDIIDIRRSTALVKIEDADLDSLLANRGAGGQVSELSVRITMKSSVEFVLKKPITEIKVGRGFFYTGQFDSPTMSLNRLLCDSEYCLSIS